MGHIGKYRTSDCCRVSAVRLKHVKEESAGSYDSPIAGIVASPVDEVSTGEGPVRTRNMHHLLLARCACC